MCGLCACLGELGVGYVLIGSEQQIEVGLRPVCGLRACVLGEKSARERRGSTHGKATNKTTLLPVCRFALIDVC